MQAPLPASDFLSRSARYALDVAITFGAEGLTTTGHTVNVSESGLLVELSAPVPVWCIGEVSFEMGDHYYDLRVRVAREDGMQYGLSFQLRHELDQEAVRLLLRTASAAA